MALMAFADSGPGAAEPFSPWIWGADAGKLFSAPAFLVCKEIGFSSQWEIGSLNAAAGKLQFSHCLYFLLFFSMTFFTSPWVLWGCSMPGSGQVGGSLGH